ncbi:hypothetical protein E2C01_050509 [Portunus trituberculatus]|uniref:Uncharacterized protein n=1 Tax=Portunus trituberculatus TaxID=210409 RepID=A0A5B7GGZ3_PORTR|nr:hypothetical protein [Portunus trituberculatus]
MNGIAEMEDGAQMEIRRERKTRRWKRKEEKGEKEKDVEDEDEEKKDVLEDEEEEKERPRPTADTPRRFTQQDLQESETGGGQKETGQLYYDT